MHKFTYVYILASVSNPARHYTGLTSDLRTRIAAHNSGKSGTTATHSPWRLEMAIAFRQRAKAAAFERYLKSHSGRAFASKHF